MKMVNSPFSICFTLYFLAFLADSTLAQLPLDLSLIEEFVSVTQALDFDTKGETYETDNNRATSATTDPDAHRDACELIVSRGFHCQRFFPRTPDGYRLGMFRLINPYHEDRSTARPVILTHGYYSSAASWLWQPGGDAVPPMDPRTVRRGHKTSGSLAYVLANYGYDVWLANFRGNRYAQNNSRTSAGYYGKFWEYSLNEMARLDMPIFFQMVMKRTKQRQVAFVGHSVATTAMFGALALDKGLNDVVRPAIMLAPATRTADSSSALSALKHFTPFTTFALRYAPIAFGPQIRIGNNQLTTTCAAPPLQPVCLLFLGMFLGFDVKQLNQTRLPVYLSHAPEPMSSWVYDHYLQNTKNERFRMFDYGPVDNQRRYGTSDPEPPEFDLAKITNRYISLFYSRKDTVASISDVEWLKSNLRVKPMIDYVIPDEDWKHMDFVWARDLDKYVNPQVVRALVKSGVY